MKYICLGYLDETSWDGLSEAERTALMDACFAYDDELRRGATSSAGRRSSRPGPPPP